MTLPTSQVHQPAPKWGQDRRLEFVDFRLHWDGRINRSDLTEFFNISVPQASLDIARYLELAPGNAIYDRSSKVYLSCAGFVPMFPSNLPERYLNELLARTTGIIHAEHSFIGWIPPVAAVPSPIRSIPPETLITLLSSIRRKKKISILYQSMTSIDASEREISPHAIAHDGFRWHVRAYCDRRKEFIDFVIARMLRIRASDSPGQDATDDVAWNQNVRLVLGPNAELDEAHKRVIELDYGMVSGEVELNCRQALLYYALKRLGLLDTANSKPEQQQIILKNLDDIIKFLPQSTQPR